MSCTHRPAVNEPSEGAGGDRFQSTASVRALAAQGPLQAESGPHHGGGEETLHLTSTKRQGERHHLLPEGAVSLPVDLITNLYCEFVIYVSVEK